MDETQCDGSQLGRVRKLLAKAERAATPEEAQAYTQKAVELMARHGIDEALLAAGEPGRDEIGVSRVAIADPYSAGKARLLGWTATALRCRAVLHQVGGGRVAEVTVFGFRSAPAVVVARLRPPGAPPAGRGGAARGRGRERRRVLAGCSGADGAGAGRPA